MPGVRGLVMVVVVICTAGVATAGSKYWTLGFGGGRLQRKASQATSGAASYELYRGWRYCYGFSVELGLVGLAYARDSVDVSLKHSQDLAFVAVRWSPSRDRESPWADGAFR